MFQFPSNGKALSDENHEGENRGEGEKVSIPFKRESPFGRHTKNLKSGLTKVSIPFKRESPFGHNYVLDITIGGHLKFPFPSNGKALSDEMVSFVFSGCAFCFNSLQTGKPFRTHHQRERVLKLYRFQFPSNGKALSDKGTNKSSDKWRQYRVSIPFKRESPFGLLFLI